VVLGEACIALSSGDEGDAHGEGGEGAKCERRFHVHDEVAEGRELGEFRVEGRQEEGGVDHDDEGCAEDAVGRPLVHLRQEDLDRAQHKPADGGENMRINNTALASGRVELARQRRAGVVEGRRRPAICQQPNQNRRQEEPTCSKMYHSGTQKFAAFTTLSPS